MLKAAGFDEARAAAVLRAVVGYAFGYAAMELSGLSTTTGPKSGSEDADFEALLALTRTLPADLPPELALVARAVGLADFDQRFEFGLQALLTGLEP